MKILWICFWPWSGKNWWFVVVVMDSYPRKGTWWYSVGSVSMVFTSELSKIRAGHATKWPILLVLSWRHAVCLLTELKELPLGTNFIRQSTQPDSEIQRHRFSHYSMVVNTQISWHSSWKCIIANRFSCSRKCMSISLSVYVKKLGKM